MGHEARFFWPRAWQRQRTRSKSILALISILWRAMAIMSGIERGARRSYTSWNRTLGAWIKRMRSGKAKSMTGLKDLDKPQIPISGALSDYVASKVIVSILKFADHVYQRCSQPCTLTRPQKSNAPGPQGNLAASSLRLSFKVRTSLFRLAQKPYSRKTSL